MTKLYEGFFEDLKNTEPYLKIALQGLAGSGKTYSAARFAGGLYKLIESAKPIVIFDTEQSSKFLKPFFAKYDIPVVVKRSRSLRDLGTAFDFCESGESDIIIIDSITHVWENFLAAFKKQKNRKFLQFQDWGILKPEWKSAFSDRIVNSHFHVMFTGRQGDIYGQQENDTTGKMELVKVGVKMKAEGETAYEPDVLIHMEQIQDLSDGMKVFRQGTVLKDRSTLIDGHVFRNPSFKDIKPVVDFLLSDPAPAPERKESDDSDMFNDDNSVSAVNKKRKIVLEEIDGLLATAFPSTSAKDKAGKIELKQKAFNTMSDTKIAGMNLDELEYAKGIIEAYLTEGQETSEVA